MAVCRVGATSRLCGGPEGDSAATCHCSPEAARKARARRELLVPRKTRRSSARLQSPASHRQSTATAGRAPREGAEATTRERARRTPPSFSLKPARLSGCDVARTGPRCGRSRGLDADGFGRSQRADPQIEEPVACDTPARAGLLPRPHAVGRYIVLENSRSSKARTIPTTRHSTHTRVQRKGRETQARHSLLRHLDREVKLLFSVGRLVVIRG